MVEVLPDPNSKVIPLIAPKTVPKAAETGTAPYHRSPVSSNDDGQVEVEGTATPELLLFSENFACPEHGAVMTELSPRLFSFNSPYGACSHCHGLGNYGHSRQS